MMGGRIWLTSEPGQREPVPVRGAVRRAARHPAESPAPAASAAMRVLVVDDNATNRAILQELLGSWRDARGCRPTARRRR